MAKILLTDDDIDFLQINRISLEKSGYDVQEAKNPQAAWKLITRFSPCL